MRIDIVCDKEEGNYFILRGSEDNRHYHDLDSLGLSHPELVETIRVNGPYLNQMMNHRKEMFESMMGGNTL